ncbi:MAG TPA: thiamine biosynthesis protein ApbE [Spirochaeta sp.]|nr:thiamine biosynthesis protein ApbE [Spirochaeta sp.]
MNKKQIIRAFGGIIFILAAAPVFPGGAKELTLESANFFALGTTCTVSIYGGTDEQFTAVENLILDIENRMSVNIKDSEISLVNAAAGQNFVKVSSDVYKVITAGIRFSELSGGTFDISIGPLVQLWDIGGGGDRIPADEDIAAAVTLVDYTRVKFNPQTKESEESIFLPVNGMALEPGGIAKGYAADAAAEYLTGDDVESALINFGGNVLTIGSKADGSNWRIGIQNPDSSRGDYIGIVSVAGKAVVTSGKYERFLIGADGRRYHHILNTEDGYPVENGIAQVSIISTDSMTADAMSTTVFSLGTEEGLGLVESMDGVEAIVVLESGDIHLTTGLEDNFKLTDSSFSLAE